MAKAAVARKTEREAPKAPRTKLAVAPVKASDTEVSAAHASRLIGVTKESVSRWIDRGELHAVRRDGRNVFLSLAEVKAFKVQWEQAKIERERAKQIEAEAKIKRAQAAIAQARSLAG